MNDRVPAKDNDGATTVIGHSTNVQLSILIMVIACVGGGGIWIGQSRTEFETLKNIVFEIRADVKLLAEQVRKNGGAKY